MWLERRARAGAGHRSCGDWAAVRTCPAQAQLPDHPFLSSLLLDWSLTKVGALPYYQLNSQQSLAESQLSVWCAE